MNDFLIVIPISVIVSILAVRWIYFKVLFIAKDKWLVDKPNLRKLQETPVPVLGGIAVFFGVTCGLLASYTVGSIFGVEFKVELFAILAAMVVMIYVGCLDDIYFLSPHIRLVIEMFAIIGLICISGGCIDTFHGLWKVENFSWWLAVPLTVFGGVGIINAINMIDGVNGLSSSMCMLSCVFYGVVFIKSGDMANATLAFSMAASLLPFMVHNIFGLRSRMFIGDAGTMAMGILLTWFTICLLRSNSPIPYYDAADNVNMIAFALAVLCVPVFDTLRVMLGRIVKKKNPILPDKTHLHHVFVNVGVSHFITTVTEIFIMVVVVVAWILSVEFGASLEWQFYIVTLFSLLLVWGTYALLRYHADHHTETLHKLVDFSVSTHLGRTDWWKRLSARLDAPEDKISNREKKFRAEVLESIAEMEPIDPNDLKEQDRKKILNFVKGRAEVMVHDIIRNSGADPLRVYPIIFEEEQKGNLKVISRGYLGGEKIVAMKKSESM